MPRRRGGGKPPGRSRREAGPVALPAVPPVGIVGPGRAGLGLALALRRARITVLGVHGRREKPVPVGVKLTAGGVPPWLGRAGIVVLAVGDDALGSCVAELGRSEAIVPGQVVLHLSGALTSDVLTPLRALGARTGSMHPLIVFSADPATSARRFRGATFALEGDLGAVALADAIVRRLGGSPVTLAPELKPLYHAGAVFASNYLVTLVAVAARLLEGAGIPADGTLPALAPLARATLESLEAAGPVAALTGPVARGDVATVRRHLMALNHADAELYRAAGRETLKLARLAGLSADKASRLEELLR
jgi:predicted short-subunit dehydrogenase-like oxidoreductase (DUF2520 family)